MLYSGVEHVRNPFRFAASTAAYQLLPLSIVGWISMLLVHLMVTLGSASYLSLRWAARINGRHDIFLLCGRSDC